MSTCPPLLPPPVCLLTGKPPALPEARRLCGPGPTNLHPRVAAAANLTLVGHLHPEFTKVMDEIKSGLQFIFQTGNEATFAITGSGHAGIECAMVNLVERGDNVCVVSGGIWGTRVADMVNRLGGVAHVVSSPTLGARVDLAALREALVAHKPRVLYVAQGESSVGVLEDVAGIVATCRDVTQGGCLTVVDTVASLGATPLLTDEWGIDCVVSASQKVLGAPPGVALITFSPAAVARYQSRSSPCPSYYLDLALNAMYWDVPGFGPRGYHNTAAVSLYYCLREALAVVAEEGLQETWARHQRATLLLHEKVQSLGLELLVKDPSSRVPTVTSIKVPPGVDHAGVAGACMRDHGVEVAKGLGPTAGLVWRVGLMGPNASEEAVQHVVKALQQAIKSSGAQGDTAKI